MIFPQSPPAFQSKGMRQFLESMSDILAAQNRDRGHSSSIYLTPKTFKILYLRGCDWKWDLEPKIKVKPSVIGHKILVPQEKDETVVIGLVQG